MQRKGIIVTVVVIVIILGIAGFIFLRSEEEKIVVPEPGYINFSNIDHYNNCSYNYTVRFDDDTINVTSQIIEMETYNQLFTFSKEYNRSQGDDVWYPLVRGCLKMKGNIPDLDCECRPENPIELIDDQGNVVVYGHYNSHKFYVYVQDTYSTIFTSNRNIKRGYEELNAFSKILNDDLQHELSKYKDYVYIPENEPSLQKDDDQYFAVGGGGVGPHALLVSDFKCENVEGRMVSILLQIKYKTDIDYSNENTLKIIYEETIDTGFKFNSSEEETEVVIDVSNKFDLDEVIIEDLSLYYENHGGFVPTPVIYFELTLIEVTTYNI